MSSDEKTGSEYANLTEMDSYRQMQNIREEIAKEEPLIGEKQKIDTLIEESKGNEQRVKQLEIIKSKYQAVRRIRRDGDCMYRAFMLGLVDFCGNKDNTLVATQLIEHVNDLLEVITQYHDKFLVEDFHQMLVDELQWALNNNPTSDEIASRVSDPELAPSCIATLRILTGCEMLSKPDVYSFIVPPGSSLAHFVNTEVNPLGVDGDHVQLNALASILAVPINVVYADRGRDGQLNVEVVGTTGKIQPIATILYRPGHYDILYPQ